MSETGAERQLTLEQAKQSGHDTCDAVVCKTCNSAFYEGTWHKLAVESECTPGATPPKCPTCGHTKRDEPLCLNTKFWHKDFVHDACVPTCEPCTDPWHKAAPKPAGGTPSKQEIETLELESKLLHSILDVIQEELGCSPGNLRVAIADLKHSAANTTTSATGADVPRLYNPAKAQGSLSEGNVKAESESRQAAQIVGGGTLTAEEFYKEWAKEKANDVRGNWPIRFADALSARNTAALTREFEHSSKLATKRWDGITSNLRAEIEELKGELTRLRSQCPTPFCPNWSAPSAVPQPPATKEKP